MAQPDSCEPVAIDDACRFILERKQLHAAGVGPLHLMRWIRAYVARKYLGPAGIDLDLSMSDFQALRP